MSLEVPIEHSTLTDSGSLTQAVPREGYDASGDQIMKSDVCYAGLGVRFAALFVDLLVFCAFFFLITRLVKGVWLMSPNDHRWNSGLFISDPICIVFFILMILYYVLLEGWFGLTLGKWALGMRVIAVDGGKPGVKKAALRNVLRAVDSLPVFNILDALLILRSPERTRVGDRWARTRVVHVRKMNVRQVTAPAG